jgi:C1A family cysteine protease
MVEIAERKIARYGWQRDLPDDRDYLYEEHHETLNANQMPKKISLVPNMPDIYDQLQIGSCVGNGTARVMEYIENAQGNGFVTPSRLFIYGNARRYEGTYATDSGAQVRDGIKGVAQYGAPPESDWPYSDASPGPFNETIPANVYADATKFEAIQYSKITVGVTPGAPMRTAIYNGTPIVFGFSVPSYFEDGSWDPSTTPLPLPNGQSRYIGGHCVVVSGYDFTRTEFPVDVFEIDNSWGAGWGLGGRFYMNAGWFSHRAQLATDLWCVEKVAAAS